MRIRILSLSCFICLLLPYAVSAEEQVSDFFTLESATCEEVGARTFFIGKLTPIAPGHVVEVVPEEMWTAAVGESHYLLPIALDTKNHVTSLRKLGNLLAKAAAEKKLWYSIFFVAKMPTPTMTDTLSLQGALLYQDGDSHCAIFKFGHEITSDRLNYPAIYFDDIADFEGRNED